MFVIYARKTETVSKQLVYMDSTFNIIKQFQFPPYAAIYKHYDVAHINKVCLEKSGVSIKEIEEFENAEDLKHLPDSPALRIWFRCVAEAVERVEPNTNKPILTKALDFVADLNEEEKLIYIKMNKGCSKRLKAIKDLLEYTYQLNVCYKENDNEVK